jgi:hypothetical protein
MDRIEDPDKEVQRRVGEILRDPTRFIDKHGRRLPKDLSYSGATAFVFQEDPDLEKKYREIHIPNKLDKEEMGKKSLNAGREIVRLINEEIRLNPNLSYNEALKLVQKEHHNLILEYLYPK